MNRLINIGLLGFTLSFGQTPDLGETNICINWSKKAFTEGFAFRGAKMLYNKLPGVPKIGTDEGLEKNEAIKDNWRGIR